MLSDVSGFTQSSTPDDELPAASTNGPGRIGPGIQGHGASLRSPPGLAFSRTRGSSGSGSGFGSGSGSSVHSGGGTGPTSPV